MLTLTDFISHLGGEVKQESEPTKVEPALSSPASVHEPMDADSEAAA